MKSFFKISLYANIATPNKIAILIHSFDVSF